jgi:hypothetical protein
LGRDQEINNAPIPKHHNCPNHREIVFVRGFGRWPGSRE